MDALETFDAEYERTAQLYRGIGRFIVQFEWLCDTLRREICQYVWDDPTTTPGPIFVVLGDTQPAGLSVRMQSLLEQAAFQDGDRPIVKNVFKRLDDLIQERNRVVHGLWITDVPLPDGTVVNTKLRHTPTGLKRVHWQRTPEQIERLADEAESLTHLIGQLTWALRDDQTLSDYAVWDEAGDVKINW